MMAKRKTETADAQVKQIANEPFIPEQERILTQIQKLEDQILQLKLKYNALSAINRLPSELLIRIFFHLQSDFRKKFPNEYYQWTPVTHVSRLWRALALAAKQLWTIISLNSHTPVSPWIAPSIKRSSLVNLDIVVILVLNGTEEGYLDVISQQSHRMGTLYVKVIRNGPGAGGLAALFRLLAKIDVPVLVDFTVRGPQGALHPNLPVVSLFNSTAPRLEFLLIQKLNLNLESIPFTNLTELKLLYEAGDPGAVSFPALYKFLRKTRLQSLKLLHAIRVVDNSHSNETSEDSSPIHLSSLSELDLRLTAPQCVQFLSHVIVPQSCISLVWGRLTIPSTTSTTYSTPKSFFDTTLRYLTNDTTRAEFTWIRCHAQADCVVFSFRRSDGTQEEVPSISINCGFPIGTAASKLTLPDLSQFSGVWWASLTCDADPPTSTPAPPGLFEALISKFEFTSLEELEIPIQLLDLICRHLTNRVTSFGTLKCIIIKNIGPQSLATFDVLQRAISRWKETWGKPLRLVALTGQDARWTRGTLFPHLTRRLKGLVNEVRIVG